MRVNKVIHIAENSRNLICCLHFGLIHHLFRIKPAQCKLFVKKNHIKILVFTVALYEKYLCMQKKPDTYRLLLLRYLNVMIQWINIKKFRKFPNTSIICTTKKNHVKIWKNSSKIFIYTRNFCTYMNNLY